MTLRRIVVAVGASLACLIATLTATGTASAAPAHHSSSTLSGLTQVTTAPGIATTLLGAGILPLPVSPTQVGLRFGHGLQVSYGFPITGGNPNLSGPSGDIFHSGGINFVSFSGKHLEIGKFDISLGGGKVYATEVNFAPARIAVLDLDLSKLHVSTQHGVTVLSGIRLLLDPAAAQALNATFGTSLPTDGSLVFGSGRVTLRS